MRKVYELLDRVQVNPSETLGSGIGARTPAREALSWWAWWPRGTDRMRVFLFDSPAGGGRRSACLRARLRLVRAAVADGEFGDLRERLFCICGCAAAVWIELDFDTIRARVQLLKDHELCRLF